MWESTTPNPPLSTHHEKDRGTVPASPVSLLPPVLSILDREPREFFL
jgi:hypothetical protein